MEINAMFMIILSLELFQIYLITSKKVITTNTQSVQTTHKMKALHLFFDNTFNNSGKTFVPSSFNKLMFVSYKPQSPLETLHTTT